MTSEFSRVRHPDRLTIRQDKLLPLLFDTPIVARTHRRITLPNGDFEFLTRERETRPIDFPTEEGEYTGKQHDHFPDAPLLPIYMNFRNLPADILFQMGAVLSEVPVGVRPDFCAGIPRAGIDINTNFAIQSGIPSRSIFEREAKGETRQIKVAEGPEFVGETVGLVDDTTDKGFSSLEAATAAVDAGYNVVWILTVVDWQVGAEERLRNAGFDLKFALTMNEVLRFGLQTDRINQRRYKAVSDYFKHAKMET